MIKLTKNKSTDVRDYATMLVMKTLNKKQNVFVFEYFNNNKRSKHLHEAPQEMFELSITEIKLITSIDP